jgi:tight adherence protein B
MKELLQSNGFYYLAKFGSIVVLGLAILLAVYSEASDAESLPNRLWAKYLAWLDGQMRALFLFRPAVRIAQAQAAGFFLVLVGATLFGLPLWGGCLALVAVAPAIWLHSEKGKRVLQIEDQIDGFILALANSLKSTPNIGAALQTLIGIVPPPLSQELELALKEMRVGSTLEDALKSMAKRIGSRSVESSLSAVLIGKQVGGNLPKVLEGTAASVREMKRLDGVVRTKTAEGKAQLWVIAAMPFGLLLVLNWINPQYFDPLLGSPIGYLLTIVAVAAWISAIFLARKVLAVDL